MKIVRYNAIFVDTVLTHYDPAKNPEHSAEE